MLHAVATELQAAVATELQTIVPVIHVVAVTAELQAAAADELQRHRSDVCRRPVLRATT